MVAKLHKPATGAEAFKVTADLAGTLQDRLDAYSKFSRRLYPAVNKTYDGLIERVSTLSSAGPATGSIMPDFAQHSQNIVSFPQRRAADHLFQSGTLVSMVSARVARLLKTTKRSARQARKAISIIPETTPYSRKLAEANDLPFPMLTLFNPLRR